MDFLIFLVCGSLVHREHGRIIDHDGAPELLFPIEFSHYLLSCALTKGLNNGT